MIAYYIDSVARNTVCQQVAPPRATIATKAVQLCGPPTVISLLPFVVLLGLLLWPDVSEVAVSGVVTLKRRVREQEVRQDAIESRLVQLSNHLTQLSVLAQAQGQSQAASANITNVYAPDQEDVRRSIAGKESGTGGLAGPSVAHGAPPEERAQLLGEFMETYAKLEPYISSFGRAWDPDRAEHLNPSQHTLVAEWNEVFRQELDALRQTRNVLVHRPDTASNETIRRALENARQLSRILEDQLTNANRD